MYGPYGDQTFILDVVHTMLQPTELVLDCTSFYLNNTEIWFVQVSYSKENLFSFKVMVIRTMTSYVLGAVSMSHKTENVEDHLKRAKKCGHGQQWSC